MREGATGGGGALRRGGRVVLGLTVTVTWPSKPPSSSRVSLTGLAMFDVGVHTVKFTDVIALGLS